MIVLTKISCKELCQLKVSYYRIVKLEEEGTLKKSSILSVFFHSLENEIIKIYPNPFEGHTNVNYSSLSGESLELTITDFTGRVLETIETRSGEVVEIGHFLAPGTYIVYSKVNGQSVNVQKIIKVQ